MRLLVVDDHVLIREGLRSLLRELGDDLRLSEAASLDEALGILAMDRAFDLVLLDLNLPDSTGTDTLARMLARHPTQSVMVLSAEDERSCMHRCLALGAVGFVAKSSVSAALISAIRVAMSGTTLPAPILPATTQHVPRVAAAEPPPELTGAELACKIGLTERQLEVLALIMKGKSNKMICSELDLAESTVKLHVSAILRALHVASRTQAVLEATRMGFKIVA